MAMQAAQPSAVQAIDSRATQVRWVSATSVEEHRWADVESLLARREGFVWIDLVECDEPGAKRLGDLFGFHGLALRDVLDRSHLPTIPPSADHLLLSRQPSEAAA